jgi:hypothetical protein
VQALAEATDGFSRFHVETVAAMPEAGVDLSALGRPAPA